MPQKLVGDVAVQDNGAHQGGVAFGVADRVEIATTTTGIILMSVHLQHQQRMADMMEELIYYVDSLRSDKNTPGSEHINRAKNGYFGKGVFNEYAVTTVATGY